MDSGQAISNTANGLAPPGTMPAFGHVVPAKNATRESQ